MKTYLCIDLKSFYASCECVKRNLDPLTTNLVVADASRTEKTICLAVSPSLKEMGVPSRPRLFEVNSIIENINKSRKNKSNNYTLIEESYDKYVLQTNKNMKVGFIIAPPHMQEYISISASIYAIYTSFVAKEDIHIYSIDEVFMDISKYLPMYNLSAVELANKIIKEVLKKTGITATAGIGTNLYLAKVAMDIIAKHIPPDKNGVRIAFLDEYKYRELLWDHTPITDFWRVGKGYAARLSKHNIFTMGDIALCSLNKMSANQNEDLLYELFGVNAELLIDHAWGFEPCTIEDIKNYKAENKSLGIGQVLKRPYSFIESKTIVKEMLEQLCFNLLEKKLVTSLIVLSVGYDVTNLQNTVLKNKYAHQTKIDHYGRTLIKPGHGSINLEHYSSSYKYLKPFVLKLYENITDSLLYIRRINLSCLVKDESKVQENIQLSLFDNQELLKKEQSDAAKEKKVQSTLLKIKEKYGKNSVIKAVDLKDEATTKERNTQIGGHKA